jgi:glucosamine--fructose-6-phosphate aminotransferase (isomerizing)
MITREAAGTIYTHAGPEIGVASTKAFTCQLTALFILAMYLGQANGALDEEARRAPGAGAGAFPASSKPCSRTTPVRSAGRGTAPLHRFPVPGPRRAFPHRARRRAQAEGDFLHPRRRLSGRRDEARAQRADRREAAGGGAGHARSASAESRLLYEKTLSNIQEVKAREGIVVALVTEGDDKVRKTGADHVIEIPPTRELLTPILEIVPLQLLAYHIAVRRGCDVDQPRNLAKSVTVE